MKLVAMNERVAAYVPSADHFEMDVEVFLNKLMTTRSWKGLIELLGSPGVGKLLARRESSPLTGEGIWNNAEYYFEPLRGSLNAWIDKNPELDYLDKLSKEDLLAGGKVYEVWIPELLSYADDYRRLLILTAVALGLAPAPDDMFQPVNPYDFIEDDDAKKWFGEQVSKPFRDNAEIGFLRFNACYWPASEYGPYSLGEDACCFACDLGDRGKDYDRAADEQFGVLGFRIYCGGDDDLYLVAYDKLEMDEATVKRIASGLIVAPAIGKVRWDEDSSFTHSYVDLPNEIDGGTFSLEKGFGLAGDKFDFTRWQDELTEAVEAVVVSGRVILCPYCGTPIITKGEKDRTEYCCDSHKAAASKQRRERAIALCLHGESIENAIEAIGEKYAGSIARWYKEAQDLANLN